MLRQYILSPAKINLTLDILSYCEIENFHKIKTIFHKINLCDEIEICESNNFEINCNEKIAMKDNLVYKAFFLIQSFYKKKLPKVSVNINKKIPIQGGLGGGSSNFANFVKIYFKLFDLGEIPKKLIIESGKFGKDIPFFFEESKCALGVNFGEKITPLNFNFSGKKIFIYQPDFKNSTKIFFEKINKYIPEVYNQSKNILDKKNLLNKKIEGVFTKNFIINPELKNCKNVFDIFLKKKDEYQKILSKYDKKNFHITGTGSCFFSFLEYDLRVKKFLCKFV